MRYSFRNTVQQVFSARLSASTMIRFDVNCAIITASEIDARTNWAARPVFALCWLDSSLFQIIYILWVSFLHESTQAAMIYHHAIYYWVAFPDCGFWVQISLCPGNACCENKLTYSPARAPTMLITHVLPLRALKSSRVSASAHLLANERISLCATCCVCDSKITRLFRMRCTIWNVATPSKNASVLI